VYQIVRKNSGLLAYEEKSWTKSQYALHEDRPNQDREALFKKLKDEIERAEAPRATMALLGFLFPEYASTQQQGFRYSLVRLTDSEAAEKEKRICHPDYFPIYFRSAVPEEMFSNAELTELLSKLNRAKSETAVQAIFDQC